MTSGALYQRVDTQSVKGVFRLIFRIRPRSANLHWWRDRRIFSGLISLWKQPYWWIQASPCKDWKRILRISRWVRGLALCSWYKFYSIDSKTKQSMLLCLIISNKVMRFGWDRASKDLISGNFRQSCQFGIGRFIFLIATICPVLRFQAYMTDPKVPSPSTLPILYFSMRGKLKVVGYLNFIDFQIYIS